MEAAGALRVVPTAPFLGATRAPRGRCQQHHEAFSPSLGAAPSAPHPPWRDPPLTPAAILSAEPSSPQAAEGHGATPSCPMPGWGARRSLPALRSEAGTAQPTPRESLPRRLHGAEPRLPTRLPPAQALRMRAAAAISATPRPPPWGGEGGEQQGLCPGRAGGVTRAVANGRARLK